MKEGRICIGIIGSGAIALVHINAYRNLSELCSVTAVCDTFVQKAKDLIDTTAIKARAVGDYHEILDDPEIDAVSICLPPSLHAKISCDFLLKGKAVVCEKPMAPSLEECDAMIEASIKGNAILCSVAQNRYRTANMKAKAVLEHSLLGSLKAAVFNSMWYRGENYYDLWWRGTWEKEGGGCVINHAVHQIDLLCWLLGLPGEVDANIANLAHPNSETEDWAQATLFYENMVACLNTSLVCHEETQGINLQGSKASLNIPYEAHSSRALPNGFPEVDQASLKELETFYGQYEPLKKEGHEALLENFLLALKGEGKLLCTALDGRNTIELVTAIYESAALHQAVKLPLSSQDPFTKKGAFTTLMPHFHEKKKSVDNFEKTKPITLGKDVGR